MAILSSTGAAQIKDAMLALIKTDPEKAKEVFLLTGMETEAADKVISEAQEGIKLDAVKAELSTFMKAATDDMKVAVASLEIPEGLEGFEIKCAYTRSGITLKNQQVIDANSGYVTSKRFMPLGSEKWTTYSTTGHSTGGGNGTKAKSVPIPDEIKDRGYTTWKQWLESEESLGEYKSSQSSCRLLEKAGDPVYLEAKANFDASVPEAEETTE